MIFLFSLVLLLNPLSYATLQNIKVKNVDLNYVAPKGSGTFEKIQIGIKNFDDPALYPLEVVRYPDRFELLTPFVDLHWLNPVKFMLELKSLSTTDLEGSLSSKNHYAKALSLKFTPAKMGEIRFNDFKLQCEGVSIEERIENRLIADCFNSLILDVASIVVPVDMKSTDLLPEIAEEELLPGSDLDFKVKKGNFDLGVKIKYYLRARLTSQGYISLSADKSLLTIRVDRIKYGILPVTNFVMNKLAETVKNPNIEVKTPYIKIKLGKAP